MSTIDVLTEARELVRRGHCKGTFAVGPDGTDVPYLDPAAVEFCMMGAIGRALNVKPGLAYGPPSSSPEVLDAVTELGFTSVSVVCQYNNRHTKQQIDQRFTEAIERLRDPVPA